MNKTQLTPRVINRPVPARPQPGGIYTQRGQVFAGLMAGARR
jgi:hypothetical protein